ncbi:Lrp/AsnC family transcriptional regulator [Pseudonocardia benzenivorans]|uniref:Transcriptional regulator, AsnC family n=2 Tax=Pseudonocardia TaxID=1847 RepID=F4CPR5_PSEUX|nr:transcriptional regulator, AsnC family [Pseudonocardia dioxanivorans CB1190]GJF04136.1 AsnC family transcriptional regulator [Pseudonocardia sp. D17]
MPSEPTTDLRKDPRIDPSGHRIDAVDARLLLALAESPRATVLALAERVGMSRNTVQARLARLDQHGVLGGFERRIDTTALGYPLVAYVTVQVTQRRLDEVGAALGQVPEVLEVLGISGQSDLQVQVVARDADDLYRVAGELLAIDGVERTTTGLVMRRLVDYRVEPLLRRIAAEGSGVPR